MNYMNRILQLVGLVAMTAFSPIMNFGALPEDFRSWVVPVNVRHMGLEDGPFPLTLALSRGEREQHGTPFEHSNHARFADRLPRLLPLPKGEGWGEGEGTIRAPASFALAIGSSTTHH